MRDGPAAIASTFSGDEAVEVYERISGFTQRIQEEILRRSDGELDAIDNLVEEAQEGAFDVRRCGAANGCEIIRDIVQRRLSQSDFQKLIGEAANLDARRLPANAFARRPELSGKRWLRVNPRLCLCWCFASVACQIAGR